MSSIDTLISSVQERRGEWPKLAKDAEVSYSWLVKFAAGEIRNPRIQTVDRLAVALMARPQ